MSTLVLDLTIYVLEYLIERYGINRSLTNVLDSERSIRNELRKRGQELSSSDPFPYGDEATEFVATILDDPNKLSLEKLDGFYCRCHRVQGLTPITGETINE